MAAVLRILAVLLGLVLLVLAGLATWLTLFFDVNDYKPRIVEEVRRHTGRELRLDGALSVALWPRIAVSTGPVSLSARDGFGEAPMLQADDLRVAVQLRPLLDREVRVDQVALDAPRLALSVQADGRTAWGDIVERVRTATGRGGGVSDEEALGAGLAALVVQGVVVENGEVHWHDARSGQRQSATGITLTADRLVQGESGEVTLAARIESDALPGPAHVEARTRLQVDFAGLGAELHDVEASVQAESTSLELAAARVVAASMGADGEVRIDGLRLVAIRGDAAAELDAPQLRYDVAAGRLPPTPLAISLPGVAMRVDATVEGLGTMPRARLELDSESMDLPVLLAAADLDADWLDPAGVVDASVSGVVEVDADGVRGSELRLAAGASDLAARFDLSFAAPPRLVLNASAGRLDLDAMLAQADGEQAPEAAAAPLAAPMALFDTMHGEFELAVDTLVSGGMTFQDLALSARADGDGIGLRSFRAGLAGGQARATAHVGRAAPPPMALELQLADIDAHELLSALGAGQRLGGRGDLAIDLLALGPDMDSVLRSVDGNLRADLADGELRGIDIGRILRAARGEDVPAASGEPVTPFTRLQGTLRFDDGVGTSEDLQLDAETFRVEGRGTIDLPNNRLDYRLALRIARENAADGERAFEPVPIPLHIHGAIDAPDFAIDTRALLRAEAERRVQREARQRGIDAPDAGSAVREYLRRKLNERLDGS